MDDDSLTTCNEERYLPGLSWVILNDSLTISGSKALRIEYSVSGWKVVFSIKASLAQVQFDDDHEAIMECQCVFESFPVTCFQQNIIEHSILLERSIQVISFRIVFWILMPKHYQCYKERSQHWDESTYNKSNFLDFTTFFQ